MLSTSFSSDSRQKEKEYYRKMPKRRIRTFVLTSILRIRQRFEREIGYSLWGWAIVRKQQLGNHGGPEERMGRKLPTMTRGMSKMSRLIV